MYVYLSHTLASVAMLSAASAITPRVWNANTHNSLVQTHGYENEMKKALK